MLLVCRRIAARPLTCNLGWMVIRVQQRAEAQGHLDLSRVGPQRVNICGTTPENEQRWNRYRVFEVWGKYCHVVLWLFLWRSPLSKALVVPFSTSRVRAAMMSACWAIAWARSVASAPRDVIIWVPLISASPYKGNTESQRDVFST